jgi:hypothetical protein
MMLPHYVVPLLGQCNGKCLATTVATNSTVEICLKCPSVYRWIENQRFEKINFKDLALLVLCTRETKQ